MQMTVASKVGSSHSSEKQITCTKEWLLLTNLRSRLVLEIGAISTKRRVYLLLKMLPMKILGARQHGLYYAQAKILFLGTGYELATLP